MFCFELKDVRKTYGAGAQEVHALDGVSLGFAPGEFTVLCGPSGSGKTTLLNMIGLLDTPTAGEVFVEEEDVSRLSSKRLARIRAGRIGFVFQAFNLVPVLSALENVEVSLHLARTPGDHRAIATEALERVGLGKLIHRKPGQLSGGQQQRVAIARALAKSPALVIADEPTANLDSATGAEILAIMREMNEEDGVTFLFSTHDPMVRDCARRVVVLRDGRVAEDEVRDPTGGAACSS